MWKRKVPEARLLTVDDKVKEEFRKLIIESGAQFLRLNPDDPSLMDDAYFAFDFDRFWFHTPSRVSEILSQVILENFYNGDIYFDSVASVRSHLGTFGLSPLIGLIANKLNVEIFILSEKRLGRYNLHPRTERKEVYKGKQVLLIDDIIPPNSSTVSLYQETLKNKKATLSAVLSIMNYEKKENLLPGITYITIFRPEDVDKMVKQNRPFFNIYPIGLTPIQHV